MSTYLLTYIITDCKPKNITSLKFLLALFFNYEISQIISELFLLKADMHHAIIPLNKTKCVIPAWINEAMYIVLNYLLICYILIQEEDT